MHSSRSSRTRWRCAWPRSRPPDPTDRAMFDAHWRRLLADPSVDARTVRADGEIVGSVARWYEDDTAEVTYWIDRAHWGEGIATRAVRLFLDSLHERPVRVRVAADNAGIDRGAREARLRADRHRGELRERARHRDRGARLPARVSPQGDAGTGASTPHWRDPRLQWRRDRLRRAGDWRPSRTGGGITAASAPRARAMGDAWSTTISPCSTSA